MLSLVLWYPVFLPSDEWSNLIVKLFVLFLLFSINCIRGTIGWGRCSIDNVFYLYIMPASNTTTHQVQWGKNIFDIFQNEYKENYMNVPIKKIPMNFDRCNWFPNNIKYLNSCHRIPNSSRIIYKQDMYRKTQWKALM